MAKEHTMTSSELHRSQSYIHPTKKSMERHAKSKALKKRIPAHYRGNTRSEGGIPFGKAPKGEK